MSRTMNVGTGASRNRLMATVSSMALIITVCGSETALAGEHPAVWLELGWNFENVHSSTSDTSLPLGPLAPQSGLTAPLSDPLVFARSYTNDGKLTFQPDNSDWVFSASIRYGRSQGKSRIAQALAPIPTTSLVTYHNSIPSDPRPTYHLSRQKPVPASAGKLSADSTREEAHFIIDFAAGRDVGIGLFGHRSTSTLNAGVRFAHFTMSRNVANYLEGGAIQTHASHHTSVIFAKFIGYRKFATDFRTSRQALWDTISASGGTSQNFNGIGPSIQWDNSSELWGNSQGDLSFDWGVNAALIFGKQSKKIHFHSSHAYNCIGHGCPAHLPVYTGSGESRTSKSVTVPNVGGFAGVSLNYKDVKVSLGYRADLFVNAVDVGFATRKSSNLLFHGPFANLSIGVGD